MKCKCCLERNCSPHQSKILIHFCIEQCEMFDSTRMLVLDYDVVDVTAQKSIGSWCKEPAAENDSTLNRRQLADTKRNTDDDTGDSVVNFTVKKGRSQTIMETKLKLNDAIAKKRLMLKLRGEDSQNLTFGGRTAGSSTSL